MPLQHRLVHLISYNLLYISGWVEINWRRPPVFLQRATAIIPSTIHQPGD